MRFALSLLLLLAPATLTTAQEDPTMPEPDNPKTAVNLTPMKLGEFWYGFYKSDGSSEGYTRIHAQKAETGGVRVDWELHLPSYEEWRTTTYDDKFRLRYSSIRSASGESVGEISAESYESEEGPRAKGYTKAGDKKEEFDAPVGAHSTTGMGFVLAAYMPLEEGVEMTREDFNEANKFKPAGKRVFKVAGREEVELPAGKFNAWKIIATDDNGERPIWVSEDRRILQINWGSEENPALMKLHNEPTQKLLDLVFDDLEPNNPTHLVIAGEFPGFTPETMWKHWTTNDGMQAWWAPQADIEPKVDGKYILNWPAEDGTSQYKLLGEIKAFDPNKKLTFSWKWEQMPDLPEYEVTVEISEIKGGVKLKITHGPYKKSEDKEGAGHLSGWRYFGGNLKAIGRKLVKGNSDSQE